MKLQFAMDTLTTETALEWAAAVAPHVDILELGTPLIKSAGMSAVTPVKQAHPDKIVFADLTTMDAGELEADLIGVADKPRRAQQVVALGVQFVEMHAGLDEQAEDGFTFATLLRDGEAGGVPFSVAGGVTTSTIHAVQEAGADVAVAGGAIYSAPDLGAAAAALKAAID